MRAGRGPAPARIVDCRVDVVFRIEHWGHHGVAPFVPAGDSQNLGGRTASPRRHDEPRLGGRAPRLSLVFPGPLAPKPPHPIKNGNNANAMGRAWTGGVEVGNWSAVVSERDLPCPAPLPRV